MFNEKQREDPIEKETIDKSWGISPRKVYQTVGTALFREELPKRISEIQPDEIWKKRYF